jgi:acyl-CoA synthetase (AMP-forming)/AMP-acid ligase II
MGMSLAARALAGRTGELPIAVAPEGRLTAARIAGLGPAEGLGPDAVVLVSVGGAIPLIETLMALDGHVKGLLLVSTSTDAAVLAELAGIAGASVIVSDREDLEGAMPPADALGPPREPSVQTEWMMTTSGTTGVPKIVPHTLDSLARTVRRDPFGQAPVWGMVYEMTRFAGLQVALQSLIGGGTLAVSPRYRPMPEQIDWLAGEGVTHLSATPTLWRRLLMAPGIDRLPLRQATMGGEIADQSVLDAVGRAFPKARLTHIYASTEAGVGFAVNDRKAGFPMAYCEEAPGGVGMAVRDGMLWVRPPGGRAVHYLGGQMLETDNDGYVNTGDRIEVTDGRAFFLGRDSGVVNVGGVKVYPERVERTIAGVPGVGLAAVEATRSPITGALLMAVVVPADPLADQDELKERIMAACRAELEREAVPARIRFTDSLTVNAAGKITRS